MKLAENRKPLLNYQDKESEKQLKQKSPKKLMLELISGLYSL
ncbi:MAG: hypothetical protein G01um10147_508 [Microgenomates group bacterium Gr01-1014_7]|nr:MAG: hypothetical protein G01um10147_508 [Microgenomates group bacterium Gr01-1014_7]